MTERGKTYSRTMDAFDAGYVAGLERNARRWPWVLMFGEVFCFAAGVLVGAGIIR